MKINNHIKKLIRNESENYFLIKQPERIKQLGEVFTHTELVLEMIEQLPDEMFEGGRTFLDPTVGNGQFLAALAIIKRELGHAEVLSTLYGADIMADNVRECRERLLDICKHTDKNIAIVEQNIACVPNGLTYDYDFKTRVSDVALKKMQAEMEQKAIHEALFDEF